MNIKIIKTILIILVVIITLVGAIMINNRVEEQRTGTIQEISASRLRSWLQSDQEILLIDVRTEEEYAAKHIPGSTLIPLEMINETVPFMAPELNSRIVVYCESGQRSREAAILLTELGYERIYDFGSLNNWNYNFAQGLG